MFNGGAIPLNLCFMSYIVIEKHGGPEYAIIATDENGNNLVFETPEEAEKEAGDCQDGLVVCIE
jgi:hypothetical protein